MDEFVYVLRLTLYIIVEYALLFVTSFFVLFLFFFVLVFVSRRSTYVDCCDIYLINEC